MPKSELNTERDGKLEVITKKAVPTEGSVEETPKPKHPNSPKMGSWETPPDVDTCTIDLDT